MQLGVGVLARERLESLLGRPRRLRRRIVFHRGARWPARRYKLVL